MPYSPVPLTQFAFSSTLPGTMEDEFDEFRIISSEGFWDTAKDWASISAEFQNLPFEEGETAIILGMRKEKA